MKIAKSVTDSQLLELGFKRLNEKFLNEEGLTHTHFPNEGFYYYIGDTGTKHFYWLVISKGNLEVIGVNEGFSKPILLPNILKQMFQLGYIV